MNNPQIHLGENETRVLKLLWSFPENCKIDINYPISLFNLGNPFRVSVKLPIPHIRINPAFIQGFVIVLICEGSVASIS